MTIRRICRAFGLEPRCDSRPFRPEKSCDVLNLETWLPRGRRAGNNTREVHGANTFATVRLVAYLTSFVTGIVGARVDLILMRVDVHWEARLHTRRSSDGRGRGDADTDTIVD